MMDSFGTLLIHMSPALVMGTLLLVNLSTRGRKDTRREAAEARRLAVVLDVELRSLLDSYNENLDLIAAGSPFLVSTRSVGAMYRGALQRVLMSVEEPALAPVVAAFAYQQRLESYLSACTKPNGPHGFTTLPRLTKLQEVKRRYVEGIEAVEQALAALAPAEPEVAGVIADAPHGFRRSRRAWRAGDAGDLGRAPETAEA